MNELLMMRIHVIVFGGYTILMLSVLQVGVKRKTYHRLLYIWWVTLLWPAVIAVGLGHILLFAGSPVSYYPPERKPGQHNRRAPRARLILFFVFLSILNPAPFDAGWLLLFSITREQIFTHGW